MLRPWAVSQVRFPLALPRGAACLPLRPPPPSGGKSGDGKGGGGGEGGGAGPPPALVLAGDAFAPLGSRFDGCVQSGEGAAAALLAALAD